MKKNHRFVRSSLVLLAAALPVHSADLFWDGTDLTADADGGAGVWDTSATNWDSLATAGVDTAWTSAQSAIFGGAAGTVSVAASGITAAGITFNTTGYTVQDNTLSLGSGAINTAPGVEATIGSTINGSLTKTGAGTLVLTGTNSFAGNTVISAGTLKVGAGSPTAFRYFRFAVTRNTAGSTTSYNQISELHYYKAGVWTAATTGSSTGGATSGEGWWMNANDNLGQAGAHTKFGITGTPYFLSYDFGTPKDFDSYNWATANDDHPNRNPSRWQVQGSTDGTNFTVLDDRSNANQAGPTPIHTWSGTATPYVAVANATPNLGSANAYPIPYATRTPMPTNSAVQIAAGATFDLNGRNQLVGSLGDSAGGGGTVTNSAATPVTLQLGSVTSTNFSGVITDAGAANAITLVKVGSLTQTLSGSASNTYSGATTLGGSGKLLLAKTGGALAIPGNVNISSSLFGGNAAGIVLGGNEQIADAATITWTATGFGGGGQADAFFRLNGFTETVSGLVSPNNGLPVIENRGSGDTGNFGVGKVIVNVTGANSYSYSGQVRDLDGNAGGSGGKVAITKTGTGTQILTGTMTGATGPGEVNDGILRVNGTWGAATVTVTGTGRFEGTGTTNGALSVVSGGVFAPGVASAGNFNVPGGAIVGSGGTLALAGTASVTGPVTVASGGSLTGVGSVNGVFNVQAGGTFTPGGTGIATVNSNNVVTLAGNTVIEINKTGAVLTTDKIKGFTKVNYGGTLTIVPSGDALVANDTFQIFEPGVGGTFAGSFGSVAGLPVLAPGLQWELTGLASTGSIRVTDKAVAPAFSPAGGNYTGAQSVTITADSGSTIYYTLDGSTPTTASLTGTSPITGIVVPTDSVMTLKAYATGGGFADSDVITAVYRTVTTPKWVVDANGLWSAGANWDNEVNANGDISVADFTLPQTANRTVTLDLNRTVAGLSFGNAGAFTWTLDASNSSTLTLAAASGTPTIQTQNVDTTISLPLAGTQGLAKTGPGTLFLTGTSTYTGTTAINGGVLAAASLASNGSNSAIGAGTTLSIDGGTLRFTNTAVNVGLNVFNKAITLGAAGGTLDGMTGGNWFISGAISGPGSLTKTGARQMIIQASNTFDGDFFVNQEEVQFRTLDALGSTVGKTVVSATNNSRVSAGGAVVGTVNENFELNGLGNGNGALQANDGGTNVTYAGNITLATDSGIGGGVNFAMSGAISGPGGLIKVTNNTVTLSGAASNTYAGTTTLGAVCRLVLAKTGGAIAIPGNVNLSSTAWNGNNAGLILAGNEQIADSSVITWTPTAYPTGAMAESFLRLNGFSETVGGLVLATGSGTIENRGLSDAGTYGTGTVIINTTGSNSYTFNGGIRNFDGGTNGGLVAITKTGTGTQVLGGGLSYSGPTTVNGGTLQLNSTNVPSPVTVNTSGTLKGTGSITAALTVNAGGKVAPGAVVGTFAAGNTVIAGSYAAEVDGATADRLAVTGSLDITGATLDFTVLNAPTAPSYILASYTTTLTGTFTVTGLPSGYSVVSDSTAKQIKLIVTPPGFAGYAATKGLSGVPTDDFDKDGLQDAVEYVLGSSPTVSGGTGPAFDVTGGNMVFTFTRDHASLTPDVAVAVEVGTLLSGWPDVYDVGVDTASSDAGITVTDNGTTDTVTLTLPAVDAAKFARLQVTVTPAP
ncbi:beta strand repeat-containing protein [Luteolibacter sp. Populi]|uniref:beta strand repeat-containing protein n=1 Tax=Luteolibacter sp. Populi TaxID=3230487 RepID=UPI003466F1EC